MARDPRSTREKDPGGGSYEEWTDPDAGTKWAGITKTADVVDTTTTTTADTTDTTTATTTTAGQNHVDYVLSNPDLRENAEAAGLTNAEMSEWGQIHYDNYGVNEGRQNTPTEITNLEGYTQTLGPEHYQGRPVAATLEASVRAGAGSEMWDAREDISKDWNLGQYTAEGWNLAPDVGYKTGILGDTIKVDEGVGQLWSEGNKRFLQDRYESAALANDFPVDWVGEEGTWKGPPDLAGYWSQVTNAVRNDVTNELTTVRDRPDTGWAGSDVLDVGDRWSGNVRPDYSGTSGIGPGVGDLISTVPYTQAAPLDWSKIMPEVNYSTQFEALTGNKGRNWQPWATGQATPGGLVDYQIPGGDLANVTYTGGNTSLFDTNTSGSAFSSGNTTTDASGNKWVITPDGSWVPATSAYGEGLAGTARLFPVGQYDSSGNYVGFGGLQNNQYSNSPEFTDEEYSTGVVNDVNLGYGNRQIGLNVMRSLSGLAPDDG